MQWLLVPFRIMLTIHGFIRRVKCYIMVGRGARGSGTKIVEHTLFSTLVGGGKIMSKLRQTIYYPGY